MNTTLKKKLTHGFLIAVEGIDGSGKSTFCAALATTLRSHNKEVLLTKEPGATPLGSHIRNLLMHRETALADRAEFLLFAADRAQHFQSVVLPALESNIFVISDRMADSSMVYQGYGHNLDLKTIQAINTWAMYERSPDLVFFLALPAQTAYKRLIARNKPLTDFEKKIEMLQQAEHNFEKHFKNNPHVIKLNAQLSIEKNILEALNHLTKCNVL